MSAVDDTGLRESDLAGSWLEQFSGWLQDAQAAPVVEPGAMVLATADAEGQPSARTVLLKGLDSRGFEFFTNLDSRKGRELAANPRASLVFPWYALHRQVIAVGAIVPVESERADAYFTSRPYGSRISAIASPQSRVIADRAWLESARAQAQASHPDQADVPRPPGWGGFRLLPATVEFWQGRRDRLHDRLRFRRLGGQDWVVERLAP